MLRVLGERGLLGQAAALVFARPVASDRQDDPGAGGRAAHRDAVAAQVLRAMGEYAAGIPIVLNVDFGHTNPQWVLPYGGEMTVDGIQQRLIAHYGAARPVGVPECG
jgi:muramoyltetrapeptide carboxypeptidase LdcA involved in peptidoglycan recycling